MGLKTRKHHARSNKFIVKRDVYKRQDYDSALNNKDESYGVSDPHADYAMNIQDQQRGEIALTWFTELMKCQQFREVVQERYQHTMRPLLELSLIHI